MEHGGFVPSSMLIITRMRAHTHLHIRTTSLIMEEVIRPTSHYKAIISKIKIPLELKQGSSRGCEARELRSLEIII